MCHLRTPVLSSTPSWFTTTRGERTTPGEGPVRSPTTSSLSSRSLEEMSWSEHLSPRSWSTRKGLLMVGQILCATAALITPIAKPIPNFLVLHHVQVWKWRRVGRRWRCVLLWWFPTVASLPPSRNYCLQRLAWSKVTYAQNDVQTLFLAKYPSPNTLA